MFRQAGLTSKRTRVPKAKFPTMIESDFATRLIAVVDRGHAMLQPLRADLPRLLDTAGRDHARIDLRHDAGEARRAQEMIAAARTRMDESTHRSAVLPMLLGIATRTSVHQHSQLDRQVKAALGVPLWLPKTVPVRLDSSSMRLDAVDAKIEAFVTHNVSVIQSLGDQPLDEIEKLVTRAFLTGQRHENLAKDIERRFEVARSSARLIARSQLAALNGQVMRDRHRQLGIARWRWQTMRDEAVRKTHAALGAMADRGVTYNYDGTGPQPPFETGQEANCRCISSPIFDDILAMLDELEAGDDGEDVDLEDFEDVA
jgi:SPP1 gp7 family putative phage head morphogenesis protein